ncbi:M1 family metallopeptidase [Cognatitamlana onchidii]|uniref:M1 family metallopeptidase n=1 Tax=Cognatitamlana onchidii TaxID=2562860 RepID=UPI0010A5B844|nr:M1 family metallopeptidase [Algibacter onchidii]
MIFRLITFVFLALIVTPLSAQLLQDKHTFTRQDTLRGSITPERSWWDLTYYDLDIKVDPDNRFISGKNTIQYKVLKENAVMQIDLQAPLKLLKATQNGKELEIKQKGNAHFISLADPQYVETVNNLTVYYEGHPKTAVNAPWDGGISWEKDKNGNHFVASSCQGLGASVWWPCKDHMYDEVDSMQISVNVPAKLTNVSNGRLRSVERIDDTKTYTWIVKSPINNYGVNINIGDYSHFSEIYNGMAGDLSMDYYVLKYNLDRAQQHFKDAPKMMKAFEYWFGQYPFYRDGYKLVEVPYLGMEHQSSVTYGNQYKYGYLGTDWSGTGWGLKFDFIIVHESGHEWFANSITNKDIADMWIHESFTAYSESLFLDYYYGKKAASEYVIGTRKNIQNDRPIIGHYHVNSEGSSDMYFKGSNMLHTLRQLIENDEKWRQILRKMNLVFYHKTVTSSQIEDFLSQETGIDLTAFFNQYLRTTNIPKLELTRKKRKLQYRWTNVVANFDMPVKVKIGDDAIWIYPNSEWKAIETPSSKTPVVVDKNFYIETNEAF